MCLRWITPISQTLSLNTTILSSSTMLHGMLVNVLNSFLLCLSSLVLFGQLEFVGEEFELVPFMLKL